MPLKQTLMNDMKQAMKARDSKTLGVLRLLLSELKNVEIDHGEQDDAGVERIIRRMVKQWREAIEEYKKGNREDLVTEAKEKITVLEKYLPKQMSDEELKKIVETVIAATDSKQAGPLIGQVMAKVKGQADGKRVAAMVNQML
ncbi:MAG: GatB/YqeY domain-containing protein [Candidatus Woesebacteria bacterium]